MERHCLTLKISRKYFAIFYLQMVGCKYRCESLGVISLCHKIVDLHHLLMMDIIHWIVLQLGLEAYNFLGELTFFCLVFIEK